MVQSYSNIKGIKAQGIIFKTLVAKLKQGCAIEVRLIFQLLFTKLKVLLLFSRLLFTKLKFFYSNSMPSQTKFITCNTGKQILLLQMNQLLQLFIPTIL